LIRTLRRSSVFTGGTHPALATGEDTVTVAFRNLSRWLRTNFADDERASLLLTRALVAAVTAGGACVATITALGNSWT
jgi:hypothetical protein